MQKETFDNFRNFFHAIDDLIFIARENGTILFTNPAVANKLGYTPEELATMHVLDVHHREQRVEAEQIFGEMFAGQREICPLPLCRKDGTSLPVETRVWFGTWDGETAIFGISKDLSAEHAALQKFQRLFENNPALMAVSTLPERRFIDVNDAFLDALGYDRAEVIGRTSEELGLFFDSEESRVIARDLEETGRAERRQLQVRAKDDGILTGIFSGETINSQGHAMFLSVMVDITDRVAANREIAAEHALFMQGPVVTIVWQPVDGWPIMRISPNVTEVLGYSREDVLEEGFRWSSIVHPDDLPRIVAEVKEAISRGETGIEQSYRVRARDGRFLWIHDSTRFVRGEKRELTEIRGYFFDQTPLRRTEQNLTLQNKRLAGVIAGTDVGTWEWNVQTGETVFNERWAAIIGYTLEELQPTTIETWQRFLHPDDRNISQHELERHFNGESDRYEVEVRMRHKDGSWVWVLDRGRVLTWVEAGKPLLMYGTHADITARKRIEEELQETNRKLQEASRAKSEFLANMSHELRTPLSGIIGFANLLDSGTMTPATRTYVENVRSSAEPLSALINDVLDFSRIEAGKMELDPVSTDLVTLMESALTVAVFPAHSRDLELIASYDPRLPRYVLVDALRLKQVVTNLLTNAIKFTESGEVELSVGRVGGDNEQVAVRVAVSDTGIGIPPEKQSRIFESFTQADSSTTRRFGGSGLGLPISKQILELMGGTITVESEIGKGSTFSFELTLPVEVSEPHCPQLAYKPHNVIVCDGNSTFRRSIMTMLDYWGVPGTEVADIEELGNRCSTGGFDVAIASVTPETLRTARDLCGPTTALLALGNTIRINDLASAMRGIESVQVLQKPVRPIELARALTNTARPASSAGTEVLPGTVASAGTEVDDRRPRSFGLPTIMIAEDDEINLLLARSIIGAIAPQARLIEVGTGTAAVAEYRRNTPDIVFMDVHMPDGDGYSATRRIRQYEASFGDGRHAPVIGLTAAAISDERERCLGAGMDEFIVKPMIESMVRSLFDRHLPCPGA